MKLIIGGRAQGKLNYVLQHMTDENYQIYDGVFPDEGELFNLTKKNEWLIVNHFHKWVNKELKENRNPEEELEAFLKKGVRCVIISDEIGNGIVPVDAFERDYRWCVSYAESGRKSNEAGADPAWSDGRK